MRFGIIGTNWITDRLIKAAKAHPEFSIGAVYSRTTEKGKEFADQYGVEHVYTDMVEMFQSGTIDAVYIASPNSFHVEQSVLAMEHGIHVLCEKPAVTSAAEMDRVIEASQKYKVTYMEAMKSTVTPSFLNMRKNLDKIGQLRRFVFHYNQYSSRYDKYKEGIIENAFKPELGNGAKMDLGVYCIAPIVHLVGEPDSVLRNSYLLSTGAEGQGSMILNYNGVEAVIMYSKISDSYMPSEIQGENGIIEIDRISDPKHIVIKYRDGSTEDLSVPHEFDTMYYEVEEFIKCVNNNQLESAINTHEISRKVAKLLE
ncbi:Gfo/Idh/MocA family oxidoreductase [Planococcus sp. N028]|uniref:Gfo/Idh/MocA family oxidoreductase n=1 Tax=Planococcus shixiaomingii TaxID=3058393 RepID=A0ABT8N3Q5_9BACL|nr:MULTISPECIES: Gfo/Idh/MocA family oxidoreductase [unclassified Planococcus (in: firmicutes)]MDN7242517.1 Gfo/Idh/MocA family oxidoreductase [Planococcus sp. N028]WKA54751.1 Gfo/Idh/MocA family oxidoreductase [Planococcus sp. N022]